MHFDLISLLLPVAVCHSGELLGQVCVHACVCLWHRKLLTNSQERERARAKEREREAGATRKRIGGGEPRREGWIVRVRDRAEENVKLQQPGDKSFSLPLPASASEG